MDPEKLSAVLELSRSQGLFSIFLYSPITIAILPFSTLIVAVTALTKKGSKVKNWISFDPTDHSSELKLIIDPDRIVSAAPVHLHEIPPRKIIVPWAHRSILS